MIISTLRKRVFALFLLSSTLLSCQKDCRQWDYAEIPSTCPPTVFTKASLPPCNRFSGIEAEIFATGCEQHLYLNALLMEFPCGPDPDHAIVAITVNGSTMDYVAERFEGGQRLKMPCEATQTVIAALRGGICVDIKVGRYEETLVPDHFEHVYYCYLKATTP